MSTSSQHDDWRAEAMRSMEALEQSINPTAEEKLLSKRQEQNWLALMLVKLALVGLLSVGLVWFGGFGWIFAIVLVAWFLFWPR
jgi:nitrate reductase NapE component